jgi:hypothetical protein
MSVAPRMLARDEILALDDCDTVWVPVPEWGGGIYVRPFNTASLLEIAPVLASSTADATLALVIHGACDVYGTRLFADSDGPFLAQRRGTVLQRIAMAVAAANGLSTDEGKADAASR